ncbi:Kinesin-like protein KIF15, partial [Tetrabaena socialis]
LPDYVQYVGHKALSLAAVGAENARWDFDFVASAHTRQTTFFRGECAPPVQGVAGRPMADHFLASYNAAIIAYGQTGSGKTHSMLGGAPYCLAASRAGLSSLPPEGPDRGLRGSVCAGLGSGPGPGAGAGGPCASRTQYLVKASMLQIYQLRESMRDGVTVVGLSEVTVMSGSERTAKGADAASARQKEANAINRSLSTLGLVISRLSDRGRSQGPVPYRDSKLTFILQDCLGGNAKTLIVANLNPSPTCASETNMTLGFALRAKRVRNRAIVNEDVSGDAMVLQGEVRRLREELSIFRTLQAEDGAPQSVEQLSAWRGQAAERASQLVRALELNGQLEDRLAAVEAAHTRLQADCIALEEQSDAQRCEMAALEATVEQDLAGQLRLAQQQAEAAASERADLLRRYSELEGWHAQLQTRHQQLGAALSHTSAGAEQLQPVLSDSGCAAAPEAAAVAAEMTLRRQLEELRVELAREKEARARLEAGGLGGEEQLRRELGSVEGQQQLRRKSPSEGGLGVTQRPSALDANVPCSSHVPASPSRSQQQQRGSLQHPPSPTRASLQRHGLTPAVAEGVAEGVAVEDAYPSSSRGSVVRTNPLFESLEEDGEGSGAGSPEVSGPAAPTAVFAAPEASESVSCELPLPPPALHAGLSPWQLQQGGRHYLDCAPGGAGAGEAAAARARRQRRDDDRQASIISSSAQPGPLQEVQPNAQYDTRRHELYGMPTVEPKPRGPHHHLQLPLRGGAARASPAVTPRSHVTPPRAPASPPDATTPAAARSSSPRPSASNGSARRTAWRDENLLGLVLRRSAGTPPRGTPGGRGGGADRTLSASLRAAGSPSVSGVALPSPSLHGTPSRSVARAGSGWASPGPSDHSPASSAGGGAAAGGCLTLDSAQQRVLVQNIEQLEDELANRLEGEAQLRRDLQAAMAEAQHAGVQTEALLELNSALIEDLALRDERLKGFEELVARLYDELKLIARSVSVQQQQQRGSQAYTSASIGGSVGTGGVRSSAALSGLRDATPCSHAGRHASPSPSRTSPSRSQGFACATPAASAGGCSATPRSDVPSPLGMLVGVVELEAPGSAMAAGFVELLAKLHDSLTDRERHAQRLEAQLAEAHALLRSSLEQQVLLQTQAQQAGEPGAQPPADAAAEAEAEAGHTGGAACSQEAGVAPTSSGAATARAASEGPGMQLPPLDTYACSGVEPGLLELLSPARTSMSPEASEQAPWQLDAPDDDAHPPSCSSHGSGDSRHHHRHHHLQDALCAREEEAAELRGRAAQLEGALQAAQRDNQARLLELQGCASQLAASLQAQLHLRDDRIAQLHAQAAGCQEALRAAELGAEAARRHAAEAEARGEQQRLGEARGAEYREEMLHAKLRQLEVRMLNRGDEVAALRGDLGAAAEQLEAMRTQAAEAQAEAAEAWQEASSLQAQLQELWQRQQAAAEAHWRQPQPHAPDGWQQPQAAPQAWPVSGGSGHGPARTSAEGCGQPRPQASAAHGGGGRQRQGYAAGAAGRRAGPAPGPDKGAHNKGTWVQRFLCRQEGGDGAKKMHAVILTQAKERARALGVTGIVVRQWLPQPRA